MFVSACLLLPNVPEKQLWCNVSWHGHLRFSGLWTDILIKLRPSKQLRLQYKQERSDITPVMGRWRLADLPSGYNTSANQESICSAQPNNFTKSRWVGPFSGVGLCSSEMLHTFSEPTKKWMCDYPTKSLLDIFDLRYFAYANNHKSTVRLRILTSDQHLKCLPF